MPDGSDRAAEILHGTEGDGIYLSLLDYAHKIARWHGWRTGLMLPDVASPESVVNEVILKLLQCKRQWDERKEPQLIVALKGMVRSDIGHLFEKAEVVRVEPIEKEAQDGNLRTADDLPSHDLDPEAHLLRSEHARFENSALKLLLEEVEAKDNPDLKAVCLCLHKANSPKEIARLTNLPIERVYGLRRELDQIAARITPARVARQARMEEVKK
jgi:hypothetical protein